MVRRLRRLGWSWWLGALAGITAIISNLIAGKALTAIWAAAFLIAWGIVASQKLLIEEQHEMIMRLMRRQFAKDSQLLKTWLEGHHE